MSFRFRRSVKIAPGIRMNVSKTGVSASVGPRGASASLGKQGVYGNVGIPGTGMSYRTKLKDANAAHERRMLAAEERERRKQHSAESLSKVTLSVDEKGTLIVKDKFGDDVTGTNLRLMWEQKADTIEEWLETQIDEINGDTELLANIHLDTLSPSASPEYAYQPFPEPEPEVPVPPEIPAKPLKETLPPRRWWHVLIPGSIKRLEAIKARIKSEHSQAITQWNETKHRLAEEHAKSIKAHTELRSSWLARKEAHDQSEARNAEQFNKDLADNVDFMESLVESHLNELDWPRETIVSLETLSGGDVVIMDVDLPEIEDFPQKTAQLSASQKRLLIKSKPQKTLRLEYARHIHGILLRVAGTVFAALPKCKQVVISGYSQRLDPATGAVNDDYLISSQIPRDTFAKINFDNLEGVDPIEAFTQFTTRRNMTATGVFKPTEPFTSSL